MHTKEELSTYQQKLEEEKRRILREKEESQKSLDFGSDNDHADEETDEAEEFSNELGVQKALDQRVNEIDMALSRIAMGTYGVCESCGKEIEKAVLDVAPESILCTECKKKAL